MYKISTPSNTSFLDTLVLNAPVLIPVPAKYIDSFLQAQAGCPKPASHQELLRSFQYRRRY